MTIASAAKIVYFIPNQNSKSFIGVGVLVLSAAEASFRIRQEEMIMKGHDNDEIDHILFRIIPVLYHLHEMILNGNSGEVGMITRCVLNTRPRPTH